MRRALIGILMAATVASPLAAQTADSSQQRRSGFGSRIRAAVTERNEQRQEQVAQRTEQRTEQRQERREDRQQERQQERQSRRDDRTTQSTGQAATQRSETRQRSGSWGQNINRAIRNEERQDRQRERLENRAERQWYRDWRRDSRYDWQRYRSSNRGLFGGSYYSPIWGSRYSRLSIGIRLGSPFYSDRYWLNDPYQYRLPPAYAGTRWVRYYDDVLLVDMYSGEVVDVIYNFFW